MQNKKAGKKLTILATALLLMGTLCGCGKGKATTVNVGYFNNVTHAQALYMKSEHILEDAFGEDVNVQWTAFNAGPSEVEALFAGSIDIGFIGPVPAITANVKSGGDVQILCSATKGGAILVVGEGSDINSIHDLDGKTVAIPQIGNTQHLNLLAILQENGLAPKDAGGSVNVVAVENADVANTMERGDIDAALVPEPWGARLLAMGCRLVMNYDEIMNGDYDVAVVVVRTEFMKQHPEMVEKFMEQHRLATDYINGHKSDALTKINALLLADTGKNLDDAVINDAFTRINVNTDVNKASMSIFADLSLSNEFIAALPDMEKLYVAGD